MVKLPPSYIVANQCISVSPGIDLTQCRIRGSLTRKKKLSILSLQRQILPGLLRYSLCENPSLVGQNLVVQTHLYGKHFCENTYTYMANTFGPKTCAANSCLANTYAVVVT